MHNVLFSPHPFQYVLFLVFFDNSHSNRCEAVYHCGLDIFNNHIIRNNSFKLINPLPKKIIQEEKNVFNTIEDLMRDASGNHIPLSKRTDIGDYDSNIQTLRNKHLYDIDDIDNNELDVMRDRYLGIIATAYRLEITGLFHTKPVVNDEFMKKCYNRNFIRQDDTKDIIKELGWQMYSYFLKRMFEFQKSIYMQIYMFLQDRNLWKR